MLIVLQSSLVQGWLDHTMKNEVFFIIRKCDCGHVCGVKQYFRVLFMIFLDADHIQPKAV